MRVVSFDGANYKQAQRSAVFIAGPRARVDLIYYLLAKHKLVVGYTRARTYTYVYRAKLAHGNQMHG